MRFASARTTHAKRTKFIHFKHKTFSVRLKLIAWCLVWWLPKLTSLNNIIKVNMVDKRLCIYLSHMPVWQELRVCNTFNICLKVYLSSTLKISRILIYTWAKSSFLTSIILSGIIVGNRGLSSSTNGQIFIDHFGTFISIKVNLMIN